MKLYQSPFLPPPPVALVVSIPPIFPLHESAWSEIDINAVQYPYPNWFERVGTRKNRCWRLDYWDLGVVPVSSSLGGGGLLL